MIENLSAYYTFYMVAKTGNISNASKELFISQPAVSKSIIKLETNLNTKLFLRSARGVTLTREGEILYRKLKEAFHAIELGEEQLLYESSLGVGHLSIGVSTTLCKYMLLPYLQAFVQKNPHIKLTIACQPTIQTQKDLENGSIDIGLIAEPSNVDAYYFTKIAEVEDIFVTTSSYLDNLRIRSNKNIPAVNSTYKKNDYNLNDIFGDATLMLLDKGNITRQYVDKYLIAHEIYPQNLLEVSTMDLLIEFAKIDIGIACVIKSFVEKDLESKTLVTFPLPFKFPHRNIGFAWSKKDSINPALHTFLKFVHTLNR